MRLDFTIEEVRLHQADAAIDVVADAAGGNDAALVGIGGADAADAEAIAPVDVGHGQAGVLDAGQERDIGDLLGGLIVLELLQQRSLAKIRPSTRMPGL